MLLEEFMASQVNISMQKLGQNENVNKFSVRTVKMHLDLYNAWEMI